MTKISNKTVYDIIFNRGLIPSKVNDENYEDKRMAYAVRQLIEIRNSEVKILSLIKSLSNIKYKLFIYTDDDYTVEIKDKIIDYSDYVCFTSLEDVEKSISECIITPDDGFLRDLLNESIKSIKDGKNYYFDGNQTIELFEV